MSEQALHWESLALVDTLRFRLSADTVVKREDVRVYAEVQALVSANDRDQSALEARVREMLVRFIDAKWTVVSTQRMHDVSGFERVALSVSARVPPSENHNLLERARAASREGLTVSEPGVDYRLPAAVLDRETMKLQQRIVERAMERAALFTAATKREWRLGDIEFGVRDGSQEYSPKMARRENAVELDAGGELLAMGERLALLAAVVLKAVPG